MSGLYQDAGGSLRYTRTGELAGGSDASTRARHDRVRRTAEMSDGGVRKAFKACREGWETHARRRVSPGPYGIERQWESGWDFAKDYASANGLEADHLAERMVAEGLLRKNDEGQVRPEGV